jgi:hypothetical protein
MSPCDHIGDRYMVEKPNAYPSGDPTPVFGRGRELGLLSESVRHSGPRVIHVHGISGIGKSSLITEFVAIWRGKKRTVLLLDGRTIEPTESGFLHELSRQLRISRPTLGSIVRVLSKRNRPVVIALDSYELLGLLDAWLRHVFLSRIGKNVRMILVSRFAPANGPRHPNGGDRSARLTWGRLTTARRSSCWEASVQRERGHAR